MKKTFLIFAIVFTTLLNAQQKSKIIVNGVGSVEVFPDAAEFTLQLKFIKPKLKESLDETYKTVKLY